ncbi:MAG TPA: hypothetical protein VEV81_06210 [Pyrinomonadaceae bacterium]|nr:hypothetical protein [Pyrinomonadaceae bacterium]
MKTSSLIWMPILLLALSNLSPGEQRSAQLVRVERERLDVSAELKPAPPANILSVQTSPPFSSEKGLFTIKLPTGFPAFQEKVQAQPTSVGDIELHIFSSETASGACIAGYSDYPSATFQGRSTQQMLEDGRDGALKSVNGTLEKQKSITVQGYPGLSIYGSAMMGNKQVYFRFDYLLVQPRFYQIGFLGYDKTRFEGPEVTDYFKSFQITHETHR